MKNRARLGLGGKYYYLYQRMCHCYVVTEMILQSLSSSQINTHSHEGIKLLRISLTVLSRDSEIDSFLVRIVV